MADIIVEDGTITPNANSYVQREDYILYAESMGVAIPDDEAADVELIKAAQFINSKGPRLKGDLVDRDQPMAFPRTNLSLEGFAWADTEIPRQVILCQLALALDIHQGIDPFNPPVNPNRAVKREKVDVLEVEYMGNDTAAVLSRDSQWQALLSLLMRRNGLSIAFTRSLGV